jgi:uncharacterized protein (TIGR01777 family)
MRVVVTGGTGFIGRRLGARLLERGHEVVVLSRGGPRPGLPSGIRVVLWQTGAPGWEAAVDGADGIVNLAGENVARRWTAAAKARIVSSRLDAVAALAGAIAKARKTPSVLVNASAVGYYGSRGDEELDETARPGDGFLARTCIAWEDAANRLAGPGLRVVRVRIGTVLSAEGGALGKMLPAFKAFAGGPIGSGTQWMSWIHRDDLVDLLLVALEDGRAAGPLNGTSPNPARNRDFAAALGKALHRPAIAAVPASAVKLLLGEMATVVLEGQRAVPAGARALGFEFRFPRLAEALAEAVRR